MGPASAPARPAKAHPMPKTSSQMRLRSMPRARTMSGSREPARMTRPTLVRVRKAQRASSTTTVTAMTKRRYAGNAMKPRLTAPPSSRGGIEGEPDLSPDELGRLDEHERESESEEERIVRAPPVEPPDEE